MYSRICVPIDSTPRSHKAAILAERLSSVLESELVGLQIDSRSNYRAGLERLNALLPEHKRSNLNGEGKSPLTPLDLPFASQVISGRPHKAISQAVKDGEFELVILGATRANEPTDIHVGATCDRFIRSTQVDTLVVKQEDQGSSNESDTILVCMDGSQHAFGGLLTAIELGEKLGKTVEAVAVYDPYLHYTLFNGIVTVLSEEAASVFKFKDQEKLHEEIIDTGLAKIYQAHLEIARELSKERGVDLKITLLDGKAFQKILRHANQIQPWLMVMGRIGVHSEEGMDVGATTENLLRSVPCDVLISSRTYVPPVDVEAKANIEWSPEALTKMERVPSFVKGVATAAILRWAKERGHSIVTASVINEAMGDLLPAGAAQAMGYVAEAVAKKKDNLNEGKTFICPNCGHAIKNLRPALCIVCKTDGAKFEMIDQQALQSAGTLTSGHLEEETFDGKKLTWESGAKTVLRRVPSGYDRRRSKARIEKTARVRGIQLITEEFAIDMIDQDMADTAYLTPKGETVRVEIKSDERGDDNEYIARADSPFTWTNAAWKRMCRVPEGFMRNMTRDKVEQYAARNEIARINFESCEAGIAEGRRVMAEMLGSYGNEEAAEKAVAMAVSSQNKKEEATLACPVDHSDPESAKAAASAFSQCPVDHADMETAKAGEEAKCPVDHTNLEAAKAVAGEEAKCPVDHSNLEAAKAVAGAEAKCPVDHSAKTETEATPDWTEEAKQRVNEATQNVVEAGKFTPERADDLSRNLAETRAREKRIDQIGASFMQKLGKQMGYGHPLSERTTEHEFEWTPEALAQLNDIPDFCREFTKWRVEWTAVKNDLGRVITPEIMKVKYEMWGEVSERILTEDGQALKWDESTAERIARIPEFVKGQVIQSIEGNAKKWGCNRVTDDVLDRVIQKWVDTGDFHESEYGYK